MDAFHDYLDKSITLGERLNNTFDEAHIFQEQRAKLLAFLLPLKKKDPPTYEHCVRVGLLAFQIAKRLHFDAKALLYFGLIHDVGKDKMDLKLLRKTEDWTKADAEMMKQHVVEGHRMTCGQYGLSSEGLVRHHHHQFDWYPEFLPPFLYPYCDKTVDLINRYSRIVALADCFDSLHRGNNRFGSTKSLTGQQIKGKMLDLNPDRRVLIRYLYQVGVFTTNIVTPSKLR